MTRDFLKVLNRVAQVGSLRVVKGEHVLAGSNRQLFLVRAVVVVAVDTNRFVRRSDYSLERHPGLGHRRVKLLVRVLLKVLHRVAQVGSRRVIEVKNVLVIANRERRFLTRHQRVARNLGGRGHSLAERRSSSYRLCNFSRCFFQIIVYRVVSNHRPHVFIIELYIFYRFVKIYLGVQIRIAFPFCF